MKVRARVKAPEYLPEWAKCCPELIAQISRFKDVVAVVDLGSIYLARVYCGFCGARPDPATRQCIIAPGIGQGCPAFELLDLDEGPMDSGAALSGERA